MYTYPKLRTYVLYKENHGTENYVKYCMSHHQRFLIAQLRLGRLRGTQLEDRICQLCNIHRKLRMKFILVTNVTCIITSEKLCIGQLNTIILIYV